MVFVLLGGARQAECLQVRLPPYSQMTKLPLSDLKLLKATEEQPEIICKGATVVLLFGSLT